MTDRTLIVNVVIPEPLWNDPIYEQKAFTGPDALRDAYEWFVKEYPRVPGQWDDENEGYSNTYDTLPKDIESLEGALYEINESYESNVDEPLLLDVRWV